MEFISVTVSLNRSTVQFDETAYRRLEEYLDEAARLLEDNPDRPEILCDLEQAVADQCKRRARPNQSVVTLAELEPALEEIGPVQVPGAAASSQQTSRDTPRDTTRPLQQISEGAVISGVCMGLARYLRLDVTLLRVVAVLLLFLSGGGMILVYLALMLLMPYAPRAPGGKPIGKLPGKSRAFVEFVRGKFNMATS
jgi:phage shock protein PspC (stress-responsive transcriptional regulator)